MNVEIGNHEPALSLHERILTDIRDRILSGEWPPGHRIPFEHELTAEYHCSRMTVNKAISELAKAGLIERRRRSGSFVRRPLSQAAVLEIQDIRLEVEALGLAYSYERMSLVRRKAIAADREKFDSEVSGRILALKCRHHAGGRPFCLEERLISLDAVPEAEAEEFLSMAPGSWLIRRVPWSSAEHVISATAADMKTGAELGITSGSPCLVIQRRTWSAEAPLTHVRFIYPAESHTVIARFAPSGA